MWIKHPRTGKEDTMLTTAVAGFIFSGIIVTATVSYLLATGGDLSVLSDVAILVGAILTPTVAAYTARKYTDFKVNGVKTKKKG